MKTWENNEDATLGRTTFRSFNSETDEMLAEIVVEDLISSTLGAVDSRPGGPDEREYKELRILMNNFEMLADKIRRYLDICRL